MYIQYNVCTKVVSCKSGMLVLFVDRRHSDLLVACLLIECVGLSTKFSTIFKKSCLP